MTNPSLAISSLYIALLALLLLSLAIRVVKLRLKFKVGIGDGDQQDLQLAIRTHANAVEYVPVALLLLICVENSWHLNGLTHAMGSMLFLGRALHALGLSQNPGSSKPRFFGTVLTWLMMSFSAVAVLIFYLTQAV